MENLAITIEYCCMSAPVSGSLYTLTRVGRSLCDAIAVWWPDALEKVFKKKIIQKNSWGQGDLDAGLSRLPLLSATWLIAIAVTAAAVFCHGTGQKKKDD